MIDALLILLGVCTFASGALCAVLVCRPIWLLEGRRSVQRVNEKLSDCP